MHLHLPRPDLRLVRLILLGLGALLLGVAAGIGVASAIGGERDGVEFASFLAGLAVALQVASAVMVWSMRAIAKEAAADSLQEAARRATRPPRRHNARFDVRTYTEVDPDGTVLYGIVMRDMEHHKRERVRVVGRTPEEAAHLLSGRLKQAVQEDEDVVNGPPPPRESAEAHDYALAS
jgi:hypothetical protein